MAFEMGQAQMGLLIGVYVIDEFIAEMLAGGQIASPLAFDWTAHRITVR